MNVLHSDSPQKNDVFEGIREAAGSAGFFEITFCFFLYFDFEKYGEYNLEKASLSSC